MNPHLGHYIVAAVGMICVTVVIALGHGNVIVQIAAGLGGASGVLALFMRSIKSEETKSDPKPIVPPPLPTLLMMLVLSITVAWTLFITGCGPSQPGAQSPARDSARAVVLLLGEGVGVADHMCAVVAKEKADAKIAQTCADAYDTARASLMAAQSLVDGWESVDQKSYLCTLAHAVDALKSVTGAIAAAGGPKLPPVVEDAVSLGSQFARCPS